MISSLAKLKKKDISRTGGKGANLGELILAGMPVPPGFNVVGKNSEQKIIKAYEELGGGAVAVRSSATLEDLPNAAFAGQFKTYLNVIGEKDLLKAINKVQASLRSDQVISYCKKQGIDHKKIKMAVIVQKMIDADFAGVIFTANPVTGNRKEILIDANPGLGEAVVAGLVTPDHYLLKKSLLGWKLVEKVKGKQELVIKPKKGGGTKTLKKFRGDELSRQSVIKLAAYGDKIEKHFKTPQDIEWAIAEDKIYIVQSRPITTLLAELPRQNRVSRVMNSLVSGILPARPLPLAATTLGPELIFDKMLRPFIKIIGFRIPPASRLFKKVDGILVSYTGDIILRPGLGILFAPFKLIKNALLYKTSNWEQDPLAAETVANTKKLEKENLKNKSPKELIAHAKKAKALFNAVLALRVKYAPRVIFASAMLFLTLLITGRRKQFLPLIFSGLSTKVTETNENLEKLATTIRSNKTLKNIFLKYEPKSIRSNLKKTKSGREFLASFSEFLEEYGYRESAGTLSISNPSWKESPELVLGILKGLIKSPPKKTKKPRRRKFFPQKLLKEAQYLYVFRENTRFLLMMPIPTNRAALLQYGKLLVKAKVLKDSQDIFYFQFKELEKAAKSFPLSAKKIKELKELNQRRKDKFLALQSTPFVDPRLYSDLRRKTKALLVGTSGSPGEVEGTARVINGVSEFKNFRPGEILIAPYTNPAWTPLFERAAGVVVDTGGVMSHAAIVAREYKIPAVMGTSNGTQKIKTGDKIRVNGASGEVFRVS